MLNSISYIMKEVWYTLMVKARAPASPLLLGAPAEMSRINVSLQVSKVFVGAYSMLSNGTLISRVGTAVVAAMAHSYNVPVMVCCETYKFSERVLLDSICFNQLGIVCCVIVAVVQLSNSIYR